MEEEVEIRDYLRVLVRYWKVVATVFFSTVAITLVVTPVYEATLALVELIYKLVAGNRLSG